MQLGNQSWREMSLNEKLRHIILGMLIPLVFCVFFSLVLLAVYAMDYAEITHNLNVGSKFSIDFKDSMDLKMYHFAVGSKEQRELPIEDVENAVSLAQSLKQTTHRKESRRAIQNILDYCDNLKNKMYMLEETKDYDSRMIQLENNIYVLTNLIHEKVVNYIYFEAGYMAQVEQKMIHDIRMVIIFAVLFVTGTVFILLHRAFHFSSSITSPISKLCDNVNRVGHGEFSIPQVETDAYEISQLDEGIQKMAGRISLLLESVKEEEKLQHMTQLQLIQAQINPHFLYNTLDTIVWLVESEKYEVAVSMLSNLSVFFRTTLSKGKDIITLGEEIMHTRSYLDIQQVRYQDILEYTITLPEHLKEVRVPKLTLQPLAENAIYHGAKEKRGKSTIHISCREQGENILLVVTDDGIGMRPERLELIKHSLLHEERVGFGLAAVHERAQLYFGEDYGVRIWSEYGKGTRVEVLISKNIEQKS